MLRFVFIALFAIFPLSSSGHEFWIEPTAWKIAQGGMIEAHIRVGEDMKGAPLSYIPKQTQRFDVATPKGIYNAGGQIGSRPVLRGTANDPGLYAVIYVTTSSSLSYEEPGKFEKFISHKGMDGTLEQHAIRGLPEIGFTEKFSRYAKSLIGVGHSSGQDRRYGLLTEITALANPYIDDLTQGLPVQVTYKGQPRANAQVEIFERNDAAKVVITTLRTDDQGRAVIPVKPGHDYMLDAVAIRAIEPETADDPVWETLWANLTFRVPAK